ncbi:hypothetical protein N335_08429, partial [Phaethon lepturus]
SQPSVANWNCTERPKATTVAWHWEKTSGCQLCILHSCLLSAEPNLRSWFRDLAKVRVNTGFCGTLWFLSANSAYNG